MIARRHTRKELVAVGVLWAVLASSAVGAYAAFRTYSDRMIERIELMPADRMTRANALYHVAEKALRKALGQLDEASKQTRDLLRLKRDDPATVRALHLYEQAMAMDPRDVYAPERRLHYDRLALLYAASGQERESVLAGAHLTMADGDYSEAVRTADVLLSMRPDDWDALLLRADANHRQRNYAAARRDLERAVTAHPEAVSERADYRLLSARIHRDMALTEPAIADFAKAVELAPDRLRLRVEAAGLLKEQDRAQDALEMLRGGLEHGGRDEPSYMHSTGIALLDAGEVGEAAEVLGEAAAKAPNSGSLQFDYARALQQSGRASEAAAALQRAVRLDPSLQAQALR